MGKVELRNTDLLDARAALEALKNSRQHGGVRVRLQEQFDASKVAVLKRFHQEFFDRANTENDARSVARETIKQLAEEARDLQLLLDQAGRYPFVRPLQSVIKRIQDVSSKDYSYLLNNLKEFEDDLLTTKEDLLAPIKAFMHGQQRSIYDDIITFYREEAANYAELPVEALAPVQALVDSLTPFRGNGLNAAKTAVADLRSQIAAKLAVEQQVAFSALTTLENKLKALPEFAQLCASQQMQVLLITQNARNDIMSARFIAAVRDRLSRYASMDYQEQLALAHRLAAPQPGSGSKGGSPKPPVHYVAASSLKVECGLPYIANENDLDEWLDAVRTAALTELEKGNRISL
jgi:hypothetical protein